MSAYDDGGSAEEYPTEEAPVAEEEAPPTELPPLDYEPPSEGLPPLSYEPASDGVGYDDPSASDEATPAEYDEGTE